jgi:eukaryotic-like serine/threonine-protein kinase
MPGATIDPLIGRKLGPYVLQAAIGGGGMGTVYRAVHEHLDQVRAVKVMSAHLAHHQSFVRLFRREAMLAARLRHPNIVQIYDVSEQENLHYIVMEHLTGSSLRAIVRGSSPVPFDRAMHLLRQLAEALDFAHGQHVSHRDVKPANIFVDEADHLTLVDFGIARAADGTHLTITTGSGTPEYMAPEAIDEEILGEDVDPFDLGVGTDRYALGVVAYELLAGRVPFSGRTPQAVAYAHVHRPPTPIRSRRPDLPEAVEPVILRQLAKIPRHRFGSAQAFVDALSEAGRSTIVASPETNLHTIPTTPGGARAPESLRQTPQSGSETPQPGTPSPGTPSGATPRPITPPPLAGWRSDPGTERGAPAAVAPPVTPAPAGPATPSKQFPPPTPTGWVDGSLAAASVASESPTHTPRPAGSRPGTPAPPQGRIGAGSAGWRPTQGALLAAAAGIVVVSALGIWLLRPLSPSSVATAPATAGKPTTAPASGIIANPTVAALPTVTAVPPIAQPAGPTGPPSQPTQPPAPTAAPTASVADRLQVAEGMLNRGETGTALDTLLAVEAVDRNAPRLDDLLYRAYLAHGKSLLDGGDIEGSWAMYQRASERRPADGVALAGQRQVLLAKHWRAMEAAWGNDDGAALAAALELFRIDPTYRDIRDKLYALQIVQADRLLGAGDQQGAYTVLMQALETKPDGEEARARLRSYTPTPLPAATATPIRAQPASGPQQPAPQQQSQPQQPAPAPQPAPVTQPAPAQSQPAQQQPSGQPVRR